jgi:hypothetical protein
LFKKHLELPSPRVCRKNNKKRSIKALEIVKKIKNRPASRRDWDPLPQIINKKMGKTLISNRM